MEYNEYCGTFYGTPKSVVEEKLAAGVDVILEIDVNGAENVKKAYPEAVLIMLLPPSFSEQEKRLRERGTESDEVIAKRLGATKKELETLADGAIVMTFDNESRALLEKTRPRRREKVF